MFKNMSDPLLISCAKIQECDCQEICDGGPEGSTLQVVVVFVVDEPVGVGLLADVALLVRLLHVGEELALPKKVLVAEPGSQRYRLIKLHMGK